ncbi:MAG: hypothetical protein RL077_1152 [Verrucomicrobiota bacterium]
MQADGKILVKATNTSTRPGQSNGDLVRLNTDGSLDPLFHPITNTTLVGVESLPDGRVLVAKPEANYARLNSDGTVDSTFSTVRLPGFHHVLADGRLINISLATNTATLARYNRDGSPDSTYPATTVTLAPLPAPASIQTTRRSRPP